MNPKTVKLMADSHLCDGCGKLVLSIEFHDGKKHQVGCLCLPIEEEQETLTPKE